MASLNLLAPWSVNRQQGVLRVKTVQVSASLTWGTYYQYQYLFGIGVKLHRIPRHNCGNAESAMEQLKRAQRLIHFVDATGYKPLSVETCPKAHQEIVLLDYPDHLTYWHGPKGEPLVLVEPYTSIEDLELEIARRGLTALVLPHPGIYGGGRGKTTSVLLPILLCQPLWLDPCYPLRGGHIYGCDSSSMLVLDTGCPT